MGVGEGRGHGPAALGVSAFPHLCTRKAQAGDSGDLKVWVSAENREQDFWVTLWERREGPGEHGLALRRDEGKFGRPEALFCVWSASLSSPKQRAGTGRVLNILLSALPFGCGHTPMCLLQFPEFCKGLACFACLF